MINVIVANIDDIDELKYKKYLTLIPHNIKSQILKYKFKEDRYRTLLGKIILLNYLKKYKFDLSDIELDRYKKPYIKNSNLNFNISHSGKYVLCAFCNSYKIGIDIEECKEINLNDFKQILQKKEFNQIQNSKSPISKFYTIWTIKEAVLKADGKGLINNPQKVNIIKNKAFFKNTKYEIFSLYFNNHILSLASKKIKKIKFHFKRINSVCNCD